MIQSDIFVLDKHEITVNKKLYSEPHVDLHNLRKSKSVMFSPCICIIVRGRFRVGVGVDKYNKTEW